MPPTEDKRKAARETIDVLYEISSLLVRFLPSSLRAVRHAGQVMHCRQSSSWLTLLLSIPSDADLANL